MSGEVSPRIVVKRITAVSSCTLDEAHSIEKRGVDGSAEPRFLPDRVIETVVGLRRVIWPV